MIDEEFVNGKATCSSMRHVVQVMIQVSSKYRSWALVWLHLFYVAPFLPLHSNLAEQRLLGSSLPAIKTFG